MSVTRVTNPVGLEERADLVLSVARVLYVNGQSTDKTLAAAERLGDRFGLGITIVPSWGELYLLAREGPKTYESLVPANPTGVNMDRVASTMWAVERLDTAGVAFPAASDAIHAAFRAPASPTWLFALAAGAGAVALSVIWGIHHALAAGLIFVSALVGGVARRAIGHYTTNVFLQPFCAALIAGVIGAAAVHLRLSASLRLAAISPCMVLVPGPHFLNGAIDAYRGRVALGGARMLYALLIVAAITTGLLVGLSLLGVSLPVDPPIAAVPLWQDVLAAGVAIAAYTVFFSTPLEMLPVSVAVGMLAHAIRWVVIVMLGGSAALGALVACFIAGLILTPISRRSHMPFAAIGFASVVSMMPGVFLFRMGSGLLEIAHASAPSLDLVNATLANGVTACAIIIAMSVGLIVPKMTIDWLGDGNRGREMG
jgi:uncharacterized membrane protein YjjP (DUF1212 family)